jgi:hypothetical protein
LYLSGIIYNEIRFQLPLRYIRVSRIAWTIIPTITAIQMPVIPSPTYRGRKYPRGIWISTIEKSVAYIGFFVSPAPLSAKDRIILTAIMR